VASSVRIKNYDRETGGAHAFTKAAAQNQRVRSRRSVAMFLDDSAFIVTWHRYRLARFI